MRGMLKKQRATFKNQSGFTLIEILIVVILLGILATIIIPQISVSTEDAKLNALQTSLGNMRSAIEMYYFQHTNVYPGGNDTSGVTTSVDATAAAAFLAQLTQYTEEDGTVSTAKTTDAKFGPYLKGGLPINPYNDLATVVADATETDITQKASGNTAGWKFYTQTGVLMADDGGHDTY